MKGNYQKPEIIIDLGQLCPDYWTFLSFDFAKIMFIKACELYILMSVLCMADRRKIAKQLLW